MVDGGNSGAYGFRLEGIADTAGLLRSVPDRWPGLSVVQAHGLDRVPAAHLDERSAVSHLVDGGYLHLDREAATASIHTPHSLAADALVHPYLAPIAGTFAMWHGWIPFHAGGFSRQGATWLVVGDREAGKSSLMAAVATRDVDVVADDLVVVGDRLVFAGPRTLDLREDVAERYEGTRWISDAGQRPRWRVSLPEVEPELPAYAGVVSLAWGSGPSPIAVDMTVDERMGLLVDSLTVGSSVDMRKLMALATKPGIRITRPPDWAATDHTVDLLLEVSDR